VKKENKQKLLFNFISISLRVLRCVINNNNNKRRFFINKRMRETKGKINNNAQAFLMKETSSNI